MKPLHVETPLFESRALAKRADRSVLLKLEALQPTGSFKIRGIGKACQNYARQGATRFISSSGGNAGIAVAYAGRLLSVPVVVVVPETTSARARALIQHEGAELIVHGSSWQESNALALSMAKVTDAFIHPFDDPLLWQGHASLVEEVVESGVGFDAVVLSVGGGGLLCGVVQGLQSKGLTEVPVFALETAGADSLAQSVRMGSRVELTEISSVATSLGARQVCEQAFKWSQKHPIHSVVVSDRSAVKACERFLDDHRVVVEPACGASLAAVYEDLPALACFRSLLVIVCGGVTTTVEQLRVWSRSLS